MNSEGQDKERPVPEEDEEYLASSEHYKHIAGEDASSIDMKAKKEKTLFGSVKVWFREFKESISSEKEAPPAAIATARTENEKSYEGLNKKYVFIALTVIMIIILGSLFKDFFAPAKKRPAKKADLQTVAGRKLENVPQDYTALAAEEKRRKAERNRNQSKKDNKGVVVNDAGEKVVSAPKEKVQAPAKPRPQRVPPQTNKVQRKSEMELLAEEAIKSDIGFGIVNTKLKANGR